MERFKQFHKQRLQEEKLPDFIIDVQNISGIKVDSIKETSKSTTIKIVSKDRYSTLEKINNVLKNYEELEIIKEPKKVTIKTPKRNYVILSKPEMSKGIPAVQFEQIICTAHNLNLMQEEDISLALKQAGVGSASDEFLEQVESLQLSLLKGLADIKTPLQTMGADKSVPISSTWEAYLKEGGEVKRMDNTPKTDIIDSSGNYRISVKKGAAQLLSSAVNETYATFKTAIEENKDEASEYILEEIKSSMKKFKNSMSVDEIKKLDPKDMDKVQKEIYDALFTNKELHNKLNTFLSNNAHIKKSIVKEAMTGNVKFGGSKGTANYILVLNDAGTDVVHYSKIDNSIITSYANSVKVKVGFKSAGFNKYTSFRMATESVIFETEKEMMNEGLFSDISGKVKDGINYGKEFFARLFENILKKLEALKEKILDLFEYNVQIQVS